MQAHKVALSCYDISLRLSYVDWSVSSTWIAPLCLLDLQPRYISKVPWGVFISSITQESHWGKVPGKVPNTG